MPQLNGAGLAYGACSGPVLVNKDIEISNIGIVALCVASGMSGPTHGLFEIEASGYSGGSYSYFDSAFLPVNTLYVNANGTTRWHHIRVLDWLGSFPNTVTLTSVSTQSPISFYGATSGCSTSAPYTCTLTISSGVLSGGFIGTGGTGYAVNNTIVLAPVGGSQTAPATVKVTSVSSGAVTAFTVVTPGHFNLDPTSFTQYSTSGSGTGFTLSSPIFSLDAIQPGWGLSDGHAHIPDGTYVQGVQNLSAGTYTIYNPTSTPSATSPQTINALGLDLTVTGGSTADIGLVSRNNSCINDRTFVVAYTLNQITLNKAPLCAITSGNLVLDQDANGIATSSGAGFHLNNSLVSLRDAAIGSFSNNHYGCALSTAGDGQSVYIDDNFAFGIANICALPTSAGLIFNAVQTGGIYTIGGNEPDIPMAVIMDGASGTEIRNTSVTGQIQLFNVTGSSSPALSVENATTGDNSGQGFYAPNSAIWMYTEAPSTSAQNIIVAPFGITGNTPSLLSLTTGGSGSWLEFTPSQLASISQSASTLLAYNPLSPIAMPAGINLATRALQQPECPTGNGGVAIIGNHTFTESDTGSCFLVNATTGTTLTIPNTIGANVVPATTSSAWFIPGIIKTNANTLTIAPATGATLYQNGNTVTSVSLSENVRYSLLCPRNSSGTGAICYLSSAPGSGSLHHLNFFSGPLSMVSTTPFGFTKVSVGTTVNTLTASALSFTCTTNPTIELLDCGTSTTCAGSPTTLGSVAVTAAGTATPATVSSPVIAVGDYIAAKISAGSCTSLNLNLDAELLQN